ncbi:MAG: hypothetical protein N3A65_05890 [candidate division WOR-3 bacterium]|nr:hypothetical protein [candidate division WOR-3 bacterium]
MRYFFYFILSYLFLPFNYIIDLLAILVYFVILNEDDKFALIFSAFIGLILDLYYPVSLGVNMFVLLILAQSLVLIKKYFVREPLTMVFIFFIFYLLRILMAYIIQGRVPAWNTFILTIIFCLPIIFVLQKIFYKVWIRS